MDLSLTLTFAIRYVGVTLSVCCTVAVFALLYRRFRHIRNQQLLAANALVAITQVDSAYCKPVRHDAFLITPSTVARWGDILVRCLGT